MRSVIAKLSLLCFLPSCVAAAQAQSWQLFSTPDKSLSVELPAKPNVLWKKEETPEVIFKNSNSACAYTVDLGLGAGPEFLFGVLKFSRAMSKRKFDETVNSNMLWIGGDDKHFSKQSDVIVNGWHGRNFVYEKGGMPGRALFINGGSRIYYLIFQTEVESAKSSEVVSRIFNSFHPLQRTRICRNVQQRLERTRNEGPVC